MHETLYPVISTFQALAVALLALLPGASYTFAFERFVGGYGLRLTDRLVRFLAASAVLGAAFSGPGLLLYREFVTTGRLGRGDVNWLLFEGVVLAYVLLPTAVGSLVGYGVKEDWAWVRLLVGESFEPRAWDFLWRPGVQGALRIKMKSGSWLAGLYGSTATGQSYAAGYPEDGDLFLAVQYIVDSATGEWSRDDDGRAIEVPSKAGLLVRWEEIEYIDFQEIAR